MIISNCLISNCLMFSEYDLNDFKQWTGIITFFPKAEEIFIYKVTRIKINLFSKLIKHFCFSHKVDLVKVIENL